MFSESEVKSIVDKIFSFSKADQTEVILYGGKSATTRYANNHIHQNVAEETNIFSIRTIVKKKSGRVTINVLEDTALRNALESAIKIAKSQKDDPNYVPLTGAQKYVEMNGYLQKTADLSPEERAEAVLKVIRLCGAQKLSAAGTFSVDEGTLAYATSVGAFAYEQGSSASFTCTVLTESSSGWASKSTRDVSLIDPEELGKSALDKALKSKNPKELTAGKYSVILEPEAVADFVSTLGFGFSALAVEEKRSFLTDKLDTKICGKNITLMDDAFHPEVIGNSFDLQGIPKKRIVLIEKGVAKNLVHDLVTAARQKTLSTGHGGPLPNAFGPYPGNLILEAGDSSLEEMINSTPKGVLVSRLHYVNIIDPIKTIITGMTRDGTFWIENGKIAYPVKNMRFTQSILEGLSKVESISKKRQAFYGSLYPALKISEFEFSSATTF